MLLVQEETKQDDKDLQDNKMQMIAIIVVSVAVEKAAQAIFGQSMRRTTIPIGPFYFQVGGGKPSYGAGFNIPIGDSGAFATIGVRYDTQTDTPAFTIGGGYGKVGANVTVQKDTKPVWSISATGDVKKDQSIKIPVTGSYSWSGSKIGKGRIGISATVTKTKDTYKVPKNLEKNGKIEARDGKTVVVDKKTGEVIGQPSKATETLWSVGLTKGEYDIADKSYSFAFGATKGKIGTDIVLSKAKKGKPTITLKTFFKREKDEEGKIRDVAVGVTLGAGKPVWKFSTGVDFTKDFGISLGAEALGSHFTDFTAGLTKYQLPFISDTDKKSKQKIKGEYTYDTVKETGKFDIDTGIPVPITVNFGKKGTQVTVDTKNLTDYIVDRIMPKMAGKGAEQKIDMALQETILKGIKSLQGGDLSPSTVETLARLGFGGKEGELLKTLAPESYEKFSERFIPKTTTKIRPGYIEGLVGGSAVSGLLQDLQIKYPSLLNYVEFPQDKKLLEQLSIGTASLKDFILGRTTEKLDEAYYDVMKKVQAPYKSAELRNDYLDNLGALLQTDPKKFSYELNSAIKDSKTKEELVKNIAKKNKNTLMRLWEGLTADFVNYYLGVSELIKFPARIADDLGTLFSLDTLDFTGSKTTDEYLKTFLEKSQEKQKAIQDLKTIGSIPAAMVKSLYDFFFVEPFTNLPYSREQMSKLTQELFSPDLSNSEFRTISSKLQGMYNKNFEKVKENTWELFVNHPLSFITNLSIVGSAAFRASGALAKYQGLSETAKFAQKAASASDALNAISDPLTLITRGTSSLLTRISSTKLGDYIRSVGDKIKTRRDTAKILNDYKSAVFIETSKLQGQVSGTVKKLEKFSKDDQYRIANAALIAKNKNYAAELPETLAKNPDALLAAETIRDASDTFYTYALKSGLMPKQMLEQRAYAQTADLLRNKGWAEADLTPEALLAAGIEPAYYPLYAAPGKQPLRPQLLDDSIERGLEAIYHKKIEPYSGFLDDVEKLDLSVATNEHAEILARLSASAKAIDDLKALPGVEKFNLASKSIPKGYKIIDLEGTKARLLQEQSFMDDFLTNLKRTNNADKALAATLSEWSSPEKMMQIKKAMPKGEVNLYIAPKYTANIIESNFGKQLRIPIYDDLTQAAKDAVLAFRPARIVRDIKSNALNYLVSGRNPMTILQALDKKWDPLFPSELEISGLSAEQLTKAPAGLYGRVLEGINNLTGKNLIKFRNAMLEADRVQDVAFKKGFILNDLERAARKQIMEEAAGSYYTMAQDMGKLTDDLLNKWAKNPEKYESVIRPIIDKSVKSMNDWIYSSNAVWTLLTESERAWMKRVLYFPEIAYWGMKRILKMPIDYPVQSFLLGEFGKISNMYEQTEDRPTYLIAAEKIAENTFLRQLGGTIWDPQWGAFNYQQVGQLNPGLKTAIEYMTGIDLRTMKPFTTQSTPWEFNPKTNRFEIMSKLRDLAEIDKDINQVNYQIDFLFNNMEEMLKKPEIDANLFRKIQRDIDKNKQMLKDLKLEKEAATKIYTEGPGLAELTLRNFPLYQWLEQALVPFQQTGVSSLTEPEVVIDKETGEEKHSISSWLTGLRLLGIDVVQADLDKWIEEEEGRKKIEIARTFPEFIQQMIKEGNTQLIDNLLLKMKSGEVPFEVPGFSESPVFKALPSYDLSVAELELPEIVNRAEYKSLVSKLRQADEATVEEELKNALDILEKISPEFKSKMEGSVRAAAAEKLSKIDDYYNDLLDEQARWNLYQSIVEAKKIEDKVKELKDSPTDTYDIAKRALDILKKTGEKIAKIKVKDLSKAMHNFLRDEIAMRETPDFDSLAYTFASQVGVSVDKLKNAIKEAVAQLSRLPSDIATQKAKDEWLLAKLEHTAFTEFKKDILGKQKLSDIDLRLYPEGEKLIADEILRSYSMDVIETPVIDYETLTNEMELQKAIDIIKNQADKAMQNIDAQGNKIQTELKSMIIKGIVDRREEMTRAVRNTYKSKQRIKTLFTEQRKAAADETLKKAINDRMAFLGDTSYESWMPHFDPQFLDESKRIPVTTWLTALAASRLEGTEKLGATNFAKYLETDSGKNFTNFESEILMAFNELVDVTDSEYDSIADLEAKAQYDKVRKALKAYKDAFPSFSSTPSMNAFKDLFQLHKEASDTTRRIPVARMGTNKQTEISLDTPSAWDKDSFNAKFSELSTYSRTYANPEYRAAEDATLRSYKTLVKRAKSKTAWFTGVLLQK